MPNNLFKKGLLLGIIVLFIGVGIIPSSGVQIEKNITIPINRGDTLYVGGSGPNNYTKIQDAADDASNGDTVFVFDDNAPYFEQIFVNNSINLIGENKYTTVLNSISNEDILEIQSDNVIITGFTIQNSINRGIRVVRFHNITIYENIFINNRVDIGLLDSCYNFIHDNCFFTNSAYSSIDFDDSSNNIILRNVIQNSGKIGFGMYISGDNNEIKYNIFKNNYVGISLHDESNIISYNCFDSNRKCAIYMTFWNSENSKITCNNFINNGLIVFQLGINFQYMLSTIESEQVDANYWDTWTGSGPNRVRCSVRIDFFERDPFWYFSISIPWLSFDWNPVSEPYDIGM